MAVMDPAFRMGVHINPSKKAPGLFCCHGLLLLNPYYAKKKIWSTLHRKPYFLNPPHCLQCHHWLPDEESKRHSSIVWYHSMFCLWQKSMLWIYYLLTRWDDIKEWCVILVARLWIVFGHVPPRKIPYNVIFDLMQFGYLCQRNFTDRQQMIFRQLPRLTGDSWLCWAHFDIVKWTKTVKKWSILYYVLSQFCAT